MIGEETRAEVQRDHHTADHLEGAGCNREKLRHRHPRDGFKLCGIGRHDRWKDDLSVIWAVADTFISFRTPDNTNSTENKIRPRITNAGIVGLSGTSNSRD